MPNPENLKPNTERTPKEREELARKAGIASGKARREKKLMSQMFAEYLEKEHEIKIENGEKEKMSSQQYLNRVITQILGKADSSSVSMIKEIREATEGSKSKLEHSGNMNIVYLDKQDEDL